MSAPTPGYANAYPRVGPVVIREIMYHPSGDQDAEYVELLNISDTEMTLYDFVRNAPWRLTDDPDSPTMEVLLDSDPPITLLPSQSLLLVKDVAAFQGEYPGRLPSRVIEWRLGRLDNAGGRVVLSKPGDVGHEGDRRWFPVDAVAYSDGFHSAGFPDAIDPWPNEANGQGASLARVDSNRYGNDPNNWQAATPSPGTGESR